MAMRIDLTLPDFARVMCALVGAASLRVDTGDHGESRRFRFEFQEDGEVAEFILARDESWRPYVEALVEKRSAKRRRRDLAERWATTGWGV